jgi:glycosyltransferase involved in cell wall biosynthesis
MDSMTSRNPAVSVIIPARNEAKQIVPVIEQAKQVAPDTEVIVVCNGVTDATTELARGCGAKVIESEISLGNDVGRAVGAFFAKGDVLLFIDADFVIPVDFLRQYVDEVHKGSDVVLNAYSGFRSKRIIHSTSLAKRLLNQIIGRPDLIGSSLTTVPHALSRRAVEQIGFAELAVPPKAQVKAVLLGLHMTRVCRINTARFNKRRIGRKERVKELVLGDHAEAIAYYISHTGERGGLTDFNRYRKLFHLPGHLHLRSVFHTERSRSRGE